MATLAMENETAKMESEAEVRRLRSELEELKKSMEARISALEALVPKAAAAEAEEHVSVETLAVIAGAVTSFLGKKVKIRSAHLLPTASSWAQAGRASVQASHNLNR